MARTYDKEARQDLVRILTQAARAVRAGEISDPGDVGQLIQSIRMVAILHESIDAPDLDNWIDEQDPDYSASYCEGLICLEKLEQESMAESIQVIGESA